MENKKNTLIIILVVIIAALCLVVGWLLGSKFADKGNGILDNSTPDTEEKQPSEGEQNINIETAFTNFLITKNLTATENGYDKEVLNSVNCISAKLASGNGYTLEIYKFDNAESAKKYYFDQNTYKLKVSNVKQLISSGNDYYEAILTPNLEESPNAIGNEFDYIYQLRVDNFYIVLFETSTNSDKTNMINLSKELKTTLNVK